MRNSRLDHLVIVKKFRQSDRRNILCIYLSVIIIFFIILYFIYNDYSALKMKDEALYYERLSFIIRFIVISFLVMVGVPAIFIFFCRPRSYSYREVLLGCNSNELEKINLELSSSKLQPVFLTDNFIFIHSLFSFQVVPVKDVVWINHMCIYARHRGYVVALQIFTRDKKCVYISAEQKKLSPYPLIRMIEKQRPFAYISDSGNLKKGSEGYNKYNELRYMYNSNFEKMVRISDGKLEA